MGGDGWRRMVGRRMGLGSVRWSDGVWGWVTSDGRTEDGYGWRQMVGGGWGWVASNGRMEDGDG